MHITGKIDILSIRVTDCSIRVYRSFCDTYFYKQEFILLQNILPIMLALCSMLSGTYYAHNYASIIGGSLSLADLSTG